MKKLLLPGILFLLPFYLFGINISVRIYVTDSIKSILVAPKAGKYLLFADGKLIDSLTTANVFQIKDVDSLLELRSPSGEIGKFHFIQLKECMSDGSFNIETSLEKKIRLYNDNLQISNTGGYLKMINFVELEHYIAGVVECEGGYNKSPEFYKAQAIICRTYALNNLTKHLGEDYELCDAVHCQVYKGMADIPAIINAVDSTKGLVIADSANHLIDAAYFSNCGGYTLNSEDVWGNRLPYLRAVKDTFCLNQLHARWEKLFALQDWENYLDKKEVTLTKTDTLGEAYWNSIPEERRVYLYDKGYLIPLKDIRTDLNLHSTYFKVIKKDNVVILRGRGNGHRVGFCQEGAMRMAQLGYTYLQILNFYYKGIRVLNYSTLPLQATY